MDLEAQVEELVEAEGDKETIADLSMQAEILRALYAQARELFGLVSRNRQRSQRKNDAADDERSGTQGLPAAIST